MGATRNPLAPRGRLPVSVATVIGVFSLMLAGCLEHTLLIVQVVASAGVRETSQLTLTFSSPSESSWERTFAAEDGATLFTSDNGSETINIVANDRRGPVTIAAEARNEQDQLVGRGRADTALRGGQTSRVILNVRPSDTRLNAREATSLALSSTSGGRQLASALNDNGKATIVAATWQSCTADGCEIVARGLDANGTPLKGQSGTTDELFVTEANGASVDMPAVGVVATGFAVAYKRSGARSGIFVRGYRVQADEVGATSSGPERLSAGTGAASSPDISALSDRAAPSYVVVWAETKGDVHAIIAQQLDDAAKPFADDATPRPPVTVAELGADQVDLDTLRPAVAGGRDGSFMVTWVNGGTVYGRIFDKRGQPSSAVLLPDSAGGDAETVDVAPLVSGYVVVWDDLVGREDGKRGTRSIQARRFDEQGDPLDNNEYTLSVSGSIETDPTAAVDTDGRVLISWLALRGSDQPVGEIRTRLLLANGMPFGEVVTLPSDLVKSAQVPSSAAVGKGAYLVSTLDKAGDEQSQGGVAVKRDQIVGLWYFPDLNAQDGLPGQVCDDIERCKTLVCANVEGLRGQRCVAPCSEAGEACPLGGRCLPATDGKRACLYDF
jgi:hypothetical protein